MIGISLWEPPYVRLSLEKTKERISVLCQFAKTYHTDLDALEAARLNLGQSAYRYRNLDETALVAFETDLNSPEPREPTPQDLRQARNRRYYLRKQGLLAS